MSSGTCIIPWGSAIGDGPGVLYSWGYWKGLVIGGVGLKPIEPAMNNFSKALMRAFIAAFSSLKRVLRFSK